MVFNSLPFARDTIAQLEMAEETIHILDSSGNPVPYQFIPHYETGRHLLIFPAGQLPPLGYTVFRLCPGKTHAVFLDVAVQIDGLENERAKIKVNGEGEILSLCDKLNGQDSIVESNFPLYSVGECNLLEREEKELPFFRHGFEFEINPFEIRTFKIQTRQS